MTAESKLKFALNPRDFLACLELFCERKKKGSNKLSYTCSKDWERNTGKHLSTGLSLMKSNHSGPHFGVVLSVRYYCTTVDRMAHKNDSYSMSTSLWPPTIWQRIDSWKEVGCVCQVKALSLESMRCLMSPQDSIHLLKGVGFQTLTDTHFLSHCVVLFWCSMMGVRRESFFSELKH